MRITRRMGHVDPKELCAWVGVEHDWEQGHSSLLRTRPDYNEKEIVEEDEVDEWLDRDQVAAICPMCAEKMDDKGITRIKASALRQAAREAMREAGHSTTPKYVFEPYPVFSRRMTKQVWHKNYGRPSERNIKRFVEKMNESLEPGGVNEHLGMGGAIYGGRIVDQFTDEVVAEWDERGIIREYKNRPKFEVRGTSREAGIVLNPKKVISLMRKWGVEMDEDGEVSFYPITEIGVVNFAGRPMVVKDIDAAVRQTAHVRESIESRRERFLKLLNVLSKYNRNLDMDPERLSLDNLEDLAKDFHQEIKAYYPARARSQSMKQLRNELDDVYDFIGDGSFSAAMRAIREAQEILEQSIETGEKQVEVWQKRRQLVLAVRNLLRKFPDVNPELVTSSSHTAAWEDLPKGWTEDSVKKMWDSLTGRAPKHKVSACIRKMEGKVSDPGAFCASLADKINPGWRQEAAKKKKKSSRRAAGSMGWKWMQDESSWTLLWNPGDKYVTYLHSMHPDIPTKKEKLSLEEAAKVFKDLDKGGYYRIDDENDPPWLSGLDIDDAAEALFENSTPPPDGMRWRGEGHPIRLSTDFTSMDVLNKTEEEARDGKVRLNVKLRLNGGAVVGGSEGVLIDRFIKFYGPSAKKAVLLAFRKAVSKQSSKLGGGIRKWFSQQGDKALYRILRDSEDYKVLKVDFHKGAFIRREAQFGRYGGPVMPAEVFVSYLLEKKAKASAVYSEMGDRELKEIIKAWSEMGPENFWMDGEWQGTYNERVKDLMGKWRSMSPRRQQEHYNSLAKHIGQFRR